jgi:hypothetical protein
MNIGYIARFAPLPCWNRPGRAVDPNIGLSVSISHQLTPRATITLTDYLSAGFTAWRECDKSGHS